MSKNIPPAGRERDKLIAELQGIKPVYACYADNFAGDEYCVLDEDKPFDCRICEHEKITDKSKCRKWEMRPEMEWLPDWSTSRNDAWELWDELLTITDDICYCIFQKKRHVINYSRLKSDNMHIEDIQIEGDSFPDAISKAWLEWKQNQ